MFGLWQCQCQYSTCVHQLCFRVSRFHCNGAQSFSMTTPPWLSRTIALPFSRAIVFSPWPKNTGWIRPKLALFRTCVASSHFCWSWRSWRFPQSWQHCTVLTNACPVQFPPRCWRFPNRAGLKKLGNSSRKILNGGGNPCILVEMKNLVKIENVLLEPNSEALCMLT